MEKKEITLLNGFDRAVYLFHSDSIEPVQELVTPLTELRLVQFVPRLVTATYPKAVLFTIIQYKHGKYIANDVGYPIEKSELLFDYQKIVEDLESGATTLYGVDNIYDATREYILPFADDNYAFSPGMPLEEAIKLGDLLDVDYVVF